MEFKTNRPIYQQIVDLCFRKIIEQEWLVGNRIPSARELAITLTVTPNTIMRAYEYLNEEKIIYIKRGTGYFVEEGAPEKVIVLQQREFFKETLPEVFDTILLLAIKFEDIEKHFKQFLESRK